MGLRGSGKSTLGKLLAGSLSLPFVDLDDLTPQVLGKATVAEAWTSAGEPAFRAAERTALASALSGPPLVLALGGGTPTAPGASDLLRQYAESRSALLIYLRASAADLRARLESSGPGTHRPSLTGASPLDEIAHVLAARDPLYLKLAGIVLEVGGKSEDECLAALKAFATHHPQP